MGSYKSDLDKEHAYPHMGKILAKRIREAGFTHSDIQNKLQLNRNAVNEYSNNRSLQAGILWNVGIAIKHNFFAEIARDMPVPFPDIEMDSRIAGLQEELAQKQAEINDLAKELTIYKEIVLRAK